MRLVFIETNSWFTLSHSKGKDEKRTTFLHKNYANEEVYKRNHRQPFASR